MDDKTIVYEEVDAKTAFYDSPKTKKINKTAAQAKAPAKSQSGQKSQKGKGKAVHRTKGQKQDRGETGGGGHGYVHAVTGKSKSSVKACHPIFSIFKTALCAVC